MLGQSFIISGADSQTRVAKALKITAGIIKTKIKLSHVDLFFLEEENSLGIEKAREIKRFLQTKPFILNYKIVIIKSSQLLTLPAQNALLKTLEEPPGNNLIFLLTPSTEPFLSTILSRCQIIHLPPTSHGPHPTAHGPRPLPRRQTGTAHCQIPNLFALAEKLSIDRQIALTWLDQAIAAQRAILLSKYSHKFVSNSLPNSNETPLENLTISQLSRLIRQLNQLHRLIKQNVNPRLALENLFLSL